MEVNCESIAVMGATLASGGVCPTTTEEVLNPEAVRDVLSLMHRYLYTNASLVRKGNLFYLNRVQATTYVLYFACHQTMYENCMATNGWPN